MATPVSLLAGLGRTASRAIGGLVLDASSGVARVAEAARAAVSGQRMGPATLRVGVVILSDETGRALTTPEAVTPSLDLAGGVLSAESGIQLARELDSIPAKMERILERSDAIRTIAEAYCHHNNFLYLGRGYEFPVALEGALKLKEISYIHAEAYPAGEMKHGPIALITDDMPVVFVATQGRVYEKVVSNIQEVRARGAKIVVVATAGDEDIVRHAEHVLAIPAVSEALSAIPAVVPLQLLSYHIAKARGCNVDQPRNLAKSVTVE